MSGRNGCAFSTLEEALNADAIIIVADASHPNALKCFETTISTLRELDATDKVKLVVINKIDDIYDDISFSLLKSQGYPTVEASMKTGEGLDKILRAMSEITDSVFTDLKIRVPYNSPLLGEFSRSGELKNAIYEEYSIVLELRIRKEMAGRLENYLID